MIYKTIIGILIMLACNENQQSQKSGLLIENKINRGINYTDSLGNNYSIRYIPIIITNDSTVSIHIQLAFSQEYNYPHPNSEEKFRLIPLPKEWTMDGVEISDSMIAKIPTYIENPVLNKSIDPNESVVIAIGSVYPRPANTTGVLPRGLFVQRDHDSQIFNKCENLITKNPTSNHQISMGLKTIFGEKCSLIPCGHISYIDQ